MLDAIPCSAGKYGVATNGHALESTACILCPNGKRGVGSAGTVGESTACELCAPGKSSSAGSPVCYFICAMGEYLLDGASSCLQCEPGTYSNTLGITAASACTPCEHGYVRGCYRPARMPHPQCDISHLENCQSQVRVLGGRAKDGLPKRALERHHRPQH